MRSDAKVAREMAKKLVIVESPAKAKTIAGYLGPDFVVESSVGHIRDLPHNASEIPAKFKAEPWSRLGVNVDKDFEPLYVVDSRKKKVVSDLKAKLKNADPDGITLLYASYRLDFVHITAIELNARFIELAVFAHIDAVIATETSGWLMRA